MSRTIGWLVVLAIYSTGCGVAGRARFRSATGPGEPLMPPLTSFADLAATRARLGHPLEWQVVSNKLRKGAWASPSYSDVWVEVAGHELLGHRGVLRLHFDNLRLEDTRFYPEDQPAVVAAVETKMHVRFVRQEGWKHSVVELSNNVHVVEGEDGWGRYVSWLDHRLLRESDDWWTIFASGQQSWR